MHPLGIEASVTCPFETYISKGFKSHLSQFYYINSIILITLLSDWTFWTRPRWPRDEARLTSPGIRIVTSKRGPQFYPSFEKFYGSWTGILSRNSRHYQDDPRDETFCRKLEIDTPRYETPAGSSWGALTLEWNLVHSGRCRILIAPTVRRRQEYTDRAWP